VTAFVEDYSAARPTPLSPNELLGAQAVATYLMAYIARCEHALGLRGHFAQSLAKFGSAYLARAARSVVAASEPPQLSRAAEKCTTFGSRKVHHLRPGRESGERLAGR